MKFRCSIPAEYTIPDEDMPQVIAAFRKNWEGQEVELFPNDLIQTARDMNIGRLLFSTGDEVVNDEVVNVECDEPALSESELLEAKAEPRKKRSRK